MAEVLSRKLVNTDLHKHLAFRAWRELRPASEAPGTIEILKGKPPRAGKRLRRLVCRLEGEGLPGSAVIGKRCRPSQAMVEDTIYRELLPQLPISSPQYYGMAEEASGEFSWLFLQDVGEREYSAQLEEHRLLSAHWLAQMHTSASQLLSANVLPDKGPEHYLILLQEAREVIVNYIANNDLQAEDRNPLATIVSQYDLLESRWDRFVALCDTLPWTLVHGDFVRKNIRVHGNHQQPTLLPYDWGEAGWGPPAIDIVQVDPTAYWLVAKDHWFRLGLPVIQRAAKAGRIFRCLDAVFWELASLEHGLTERFMTCMRIYQIMLADAIRAAKFENGY